MTELYAILLGAIQGLTEFLPVSSSGHLVLAQTWFGLKDVPLLFDVMLHIATLLAVIFFYRKDLIELTKGFVSGLSEVGDQGLATIWNSNHAFRFVILIVVASIPTGIIGVAGKDFFESLFSSPMAVGFALLATTIIVGSTFFIKRESNKRLGIVSAFIIGIAQGIAIIPGISRSGSTIATALWLDIPREEAARFSFLLSIPAILGALMLSLRKTDFASLHIVPLSAGFVSAAVVGFFALVALVAITKKGKLYIFAPYTGLLGLAAIIYSIVS